MRYLLMAFLLIVPNFYWWGHELRQAQEICYGVLAFSLFFLSFVFPKRAVKQTKVSLLLSIFAFWTVFLFAFHKAQLGFNYVLNVTGAMMIYYTVLTCLKKEDTRLLFKAILVVFLFNVLYALGQALGYDLVGFTTRGLDYHLVPPPQGLFALPAHFGIYTALALMVMTVTRPYLALLFFGVIVLSKSTGAMAGGILGYLTVLWLRRRDIRLKFPVPWLRRIKWYIKPFIRGWFYVPLFYFATVVLLIGGSIFVIRYDKPMGMFNTRPPMWGLATHDAMKRPLVGLGLDGFRMGKIGYVMDAKSQISTRAVQGEDGRYYLHEETNKRAGLDISKVTHLDRWDNPHNEWIHLLFSWGVIGTILIGFVIYTLILRLKGLIVTPVIASLIGMFVVLAVTSCTHFPFSVARIAHIVPVLLGIYMLNTEK